MEALLHCLGVLLWLKYKLKSRSIKGAEYDTITALQVMEQAPPLCDKVVNQAAVEV